MRIIFMIQEIARKLTKDNLTGYAAQSCFYIILSIFPCLLLLMSLFKFLPLTEDALLLMLKGVIPVQLEPFLVSIIEDLYDNSSAALTSITTVATIWAAGKGFLAIMQELNIIYDTQKKRNWLLQRLMSTVYTIALLVLIIATLLLLVFGNQLIGLIEVFIPRLAVILSAILNNRMILFPTRKSSITKEFPGAVFSAVGWYGFSYCYSLYVAHSPNFSYMYGSLTTLIFALVWIYVCMLILFFGAELNTLIASQTLRPLLPKFSRKKKKEAERK